MDKVGVIAVGPRAKPRNAAKNPALNTDIKWTVLFKQLADLHPSETPLMGDIFSVDFASQFQSEEPQSPEQIATWLGLPALTIRDRAHIKPIDYRTFQAIVARNLVQRLFAHTLSIIHGMLRAVRTAFMGVATGEDHAALIRSEPQFIVWMSHLAYFSTLHRHWLLGQDSDGSTMQTFAQKIVPIRDAAAAHAISLLRTSAFLFEKWYLNDAPIENTEDDMLRAFVKQASGQNDTIAVRQMLNSRTNPFDHVQHADALTIAASILADDDGYSRWIELSTQAQDLAFADNPDIDQSVRGIYTGGNQPELRDQMKLADVVMRLDDELYASFCPEHRMLDSIVSMMQNALRRTQPSAGLAAIERATPILSKIAPDGDHNYDMRYPCPTIMDDPRTGPILTWTVMKEIARAMEPHSADIAEWRSRCILQQAVEMPLTNPRTDQEYPFITTILNDPYLLGAARALADELTDAEARRDLAIRSVMAKARSEFDTTNGPPVPAATVLAIRNQVLARLEQVFTDLRGQKFPTPRQLFVALREASSKLVMDQVIYPAFSLILQSAKAFELGQSQVFDMDALDPFLAAISKTTDKQNGFKLLLESFKHATPGGFADSEVQIVSLQLVSLLMAEIEIAIRERDLLQEQDTKQPPSKTQLPDALSKHEANFKKIRRLYYRIAYSLPDGIGFSGLRLRFGTRTTLPIAMDALTRIVCAAVENGGMSWFTTTIANGNQPIPDIPDIPPITDSINHKFVAAFDGMSSDTPAEKVAEVAIPKMRELWKFTDDDAQEVFRRVKETTRPDQLVSFFQSLYHSPGKTGDAMAIPEYTMNKLIGIVNDINTGTPITIDPARTTELANLQIRKVFNYFADTIRRVPLENVPNFITSMGSRFMERSSWGWWLAHNIGIYSASMVISECLYSLAQTPSYNIQPDWFRLLPSGIRALLYGGASFLWTRDPHGIYQHLDKDSSAADIYSGGLAKTFEPLLLTPTYINVDIMEVVIAAGAGIALPFIEQLPILFPAATGIPVNDTYTLIFAPYLAYLLRNLVLTNGGNVRLSPIPKK